MSPTLKYDAREITELRCRGATPETVKKAFEILTSDPKVKSIFINIFGGTFFHASRETCALRISV